MNPGVILFDVSSSEIKSFSAIQEARGKLASQEDEDKLMRSVLQNDKKTIDEGRLIKDSLNQGFGSFNPDLMFEELVRNYSMARKIYGDSLIKLLSDYDSSYIKKNINIPEFQRELKKNIKRRIEELKDKDLIDKDHTLTDKAIDLASLVLYKEELDNLIPKGILGEKIHKKVFVYGDKEDIKNHKKLDRYRDLAIRKSLKLAIRRGHSELQESDLKSFERKSRGSIYLVYALDASGSMKGRKIDLCKKAGVALAYKAIEEKDKVGLLVFGSDIKEEISPTEDFLLLLKAMTRIKASKETNIAFTIKKAITLFPNQEVTKHLILLTDAIPTIGKNPEQDTLEAVSLAKANGITLSLVGINLDKKGESLAKKIVEIGEGNLYIIRELENIDKIVLEDYYSFIWDKFYKGVNNFLAMKLLCFVDLHGSLSALKAIEKKSKHADLIICAGDLTIFEQNLDYYLSKLNKLNKTVFIVHGNHESPEVMKKSCSLFNNIKFIHGKHFRIDNDIFFGFGGGGFSMVEPNLLKDIKKFKNIAKEEDKIILITHAPPYNTKLDYLMKEHHGNKTIRQFIEKIKPILVVCGHFHENAGKEDKIKNSLLINPGPKGRIIEV